MNYTETLDFLFTNLPMYQRTGKAAYKANLDNTFALDEFSGSPHRSFKSIHVAGTNGKGSVSHMLASIFQANGYKTGLYTSPHLMDFRERIRVDGELIPEYSVISFVERIQPIITSLQPSFFEITVAMAFDHFKECGVDIAIIETGLGGRLDSTNIITPEVSVITNISMDHTEFLGETLEKIALEKAGIIKLSVPVVSGTDNQEINAIFKSVAESHGCPFYQSTKTREFRFLTETFDHQLNIRFDNLETGHLESWSIDLLGGYQAENLATTLKVMDVMLETGWEISLEKSAEGFCNIKRNTGIRGRWEVIGVNPKIICDTAHNEEGIREVMKQLTSIPAKHIHIVWGMVGDKSLEKILPILPKDATYYFTRPSIPRAMDETTLSVNAVRYGLSGSVHRDVSSALNSARNYSGPDDLIFIGGSTFVVADALASLQ